MECRYKSFNDLFAVVKPISLKLSYAKMRTLCIRARAIVAQIAIGSIASHSFCFITKLKREIRLDKTKEVFFRIRLWEEFLELKGPSATCI